MMMRAGPWLLCAAVASFAFQAVPPARQCRLERAATVEYSLDDVEIGSPLEPLSNYLLVRVASAIDATTGGVLLPEVAKETPTEGVVVATGPGRTHPDTGVLMPMPVEAGAKVMYGKYDGTSLKYCGEDHQLIRDDDILVTWQGDLTADSVRPILDRILLKPERVEDETTSGIALAPGVAEQQKTSVGQVLKLGEGRLAADGSTMPMPIAVGDSVKYRDYAGSDIKIAGDDFVICRVNDCIAKFASAAPAAEA